MIANDKVFTIHSGGKPESPEIPGFDSDTCARIWDCMHTTNKEQRWGREGLGIVDRHEYQNGYDLHLRVTLEDGTVYDDVWMWHDTQEFIDNWRRFH